MLRSSEHMGPPIGSTARHTNAITSLHCGAVSRKGRRLHRPGRVLRREYPFAYSLLADTASPIRRSPPPGVLSARQSECSPPAPVRSSERPRVLMVQTLHALDVRVQPAQGQHRNVLRLCIKRRRNIPCTAFCGTTTTRPPDVCGVAFARTNMASTHLRISGKLSRMCFNALM